MRAKIKVGGKAGAHVGKPGEGKEVSLSRDKNEIHLSTDIPFSKRYGSSICYTNQESGFLYK